MVERDKVTGDPGYIKKELVRIKNKLPSRSNTAQTCAGTLTVLISLFLTVSVFIYFGIDVSGVGFFCFAVSNCNKVKKKVKFFENYIFSGSVLNKVLFLRV